jgi:hypothetical protein
VVIFGYIAIGSECMGRNEGILARGPEGYFLRWILHDWSDKYALKILRALIPAWTSLDPIPLHGFASCSARFAALLERHSSCILYGE